MIFDLDGVIVHSTPLHTKAWEIYLEQFGVPPERVRRRMHGLRNDDIVKDFFGDGLSAEEVFDHGAKKEALYRELMRAKLDEHIIPGVADFLDHYRDIPKAVASNAEPANIEFVLEGSGLRRHFLHVVDGHDVQNPKPAPDIYLKAAALLGFTPDQCLVFEDSIPGVTAGVAAGMRVAGLTTTLAELPGASILAPDFRDPRLHAWVAAALSR